MTGATELIEVRELIEESGDGRDRLITRLGAHAVIPKQIHTHQAVTIVPVSAKTVTLVEGTTENGTEIVGTVVVTGADGILTKDLAGTYLTNGLVVVATVSAMTVVTAVL